jgi:hypothetical protein
MRFHLRSVVALCAVLSFASFAAPADADEPAAAASAATARAATARAQLESVAAADPAYGELRVLRADGFLAKHDVVALLAQRLLTRYEVAALANDAAQEMRARLTQSAQTTTSTQTTTALAPTTVSQADIDAMKGLLDRYGSDIDQLKADVVALWDATGRTHDQVQALQRQADRQKINVTYFLRAPGIFTDHVTAYNGGSNLVAANGAAVSPFSLLPGGIPLTVGNNPGQIGQNPLQTGDYGHGTGYQVLRMLFTGAVSDTLQYRVRLENRYYFDNVAGQNATTPQYCASTPCGNDYPGNAALRINFANVLFTTPGKQLAFTAGRYLQGEGPRGFANDHSSLALGPNDGPPGLNFEDYFNGAAAAYRNGPLDVQAGYGFLNTALSNTGGALGTTGQSYFGQAAYAINPHIAIGATLLANQNYAGQQYFNPNQTLKDSNGFTIVDANGLPITGAYVNGNASYQTGTAYGIYRSGKMHVAGELLHRFGNDPFRHSHWTDPDAFWLQTRYGFVDSHPGGNYGEFGLIQSGLNSTPPQTKVVATPGYQQFYVNNPNGYRIAFLGVHHWFTSNARIGLEYQHYDLIPNTTLPASSVNCPGCLVTKDRKDALLFETLLSF